MSHKIMYETYEENVNRNKIQACWDDYAARDDWQEGCAGLPNNIRWLDRVAPLNSYEEAKNYIEEHDSGFYDQLAVRYIERKTTPSKKLETLGQKKKEAYAKYDNLNRAIHYRTTTSEFVGCKCCGSKLNRVKLTEKLNTNYCPLCRADLRPESTLKRIESLKATYEKTKKDYEAEVANNKMKDKGKVMWLVKVEWHV